MGSRLDKLNSNFKKTGEEKKPKLPLKPRTYAILAGALVIVVILGMVINPSFFGIASKDDKAPTFIRNDISFTRDIGRPPTHGDLITFDRDNAIDGYLIKRVVALPGDTVDIDDSGKVYVNGSPIITDKVYYKKDVTVPLTVPHDNVFVLSDGGDESPDSRNSYVGFVSINTIVGTEVK